MYALVISDTIQTTATSLPSGARRLDDGGWITPYQAQWTQADHEACGWFVVVEPVRPPDTAVTVFDSTIELVAGTPTVVWVARPKTANELDEDTRQANHATIQTQASDALVANATFLGLAAPTNAQNAAQIKALTRHVNKLIRVTINRLESTD